MICKDPYNPLFLLSGLVYNKAQTATYFPTSFYSNVVAILCTLVILDFKAWVCMLNCKTECRCMVCICLWSVPPPPLVCMEAWVSASIIYLTVWGRIWSVYPPWCYPYPHDACTAVPNFYVGIGDPNSSAGHYTDWSMSLALWMHSFTFIWYL